ncbi:trypsin-like serine protease [Streptomyces uncialis]|uniref:trypsin-like serine protease n=1 Tax=Streptomyces uncialis TaxID=1048205 RepID=UPI002E338946|nr:trypsin-like serine protease [Streptomyces uncialis]WST73200.1 trypsin-like serine protease [Streptomyces uncialis]
MTRPPRDTHSSPASPVVKVPGSRLRAVASAGAVLTGSVLLTAVAAVPATAAQVRPEPAATQVSAQAQADDPWYRICAGVLIARNKVLTAAHCLSATGQAVLRD